MRRVLLTALLVSTLYSSCNILNISSSQPEGAVLINQLPFDLDGIYRQSGAVPDATILFNRLSESEFQYCRILYGKRDSIFKELFSNNDEDYQSKINNPELVREYEDSLLVRENVGESMITCYKLDGEVYYGYEKKDCITVDLSRGVLTGGLPPYKSDFLQFGLKNK